MHPLCCQAKSVHHGSRAESVLRGDKVLGSPMGNELFQSVSGHDKQVSREAQCRSEAQVIELFQNSSVCRMLLNHLGWVVLKDVDRGALVCQLATKPTSLAYNKLPSLESVEPHHDNSRSFIGARPRLLHCAASLKVPCFFFLVVV